MKFEVAPVQILRGARCIATIIRLFLPRFPRCKEFHEVFCFLRPLLPVDLLDNWNRKRMPRRATARSSFLPLLAAAPLILDLLQPALADPVAVVKLVRLRLVQRCFSTPRIHRRKGSIIGRQQPIEETLRSETFGHLVIAEHSSEELEQGKVGKSGESLFAASSWLLCCEWYKKVFVRFSVQFGYDNENEYKGVFCLEKMRQVWRASVGLY